MSRLNVANFRHPDGTSDNINLDSSGNVGIGTSSPSELLHLRSSTDISGTGIYDEILRLDNTSSRGSDSGIGISFYQDTNERSRIAAEYDGSGQGLQFHTRQDGQSLSEKVRILSGGGLTFNGDTAAANALDDYEEGTWTPTLGNFTGTYTTQTGLYTKIGNIVTLHVHINVATNTGTSSLQYWIQGMPFSIVSTPSSTVGPVYIYQAATSTGHMISSMNNQPRWYVHPNNGLTSATSTNGHQAGQLGTGQIFATITYRVA